MTPDNERVKKLTATARELAQHIDWLLPFLDKRAKESGDVAGMQVNARDAADRAKKLVSWLETEDALKAKELSK